MLESKFNCVNERGPRTFGPNCSPTPTKLPWATPGIESGVDRGSCEHFEGNFEGYFFPFPFSITHATWPCNNIFITSLTPCKILQEFVDLWFRERNRALDVLAIKNKLRTICKQLILLHFHILTNITRIIHWNLVFRVHGYHDKCNHGTLSQMVYELIIQIFHLIWMLWLENNYWIDVNTCANVWSDISYEVRYDCEGVPDLDYSIYNLSVHNLHVDNIYNDIHTITPRKIHLIKSRGPAFPFLHLSGYINCHDSQIPIGIVASGSRDW